MPRPTTVVMTGPTAVNQLWHQHMRAVEDLNTGQEYTAGEVFHVEPDLIGIYLFEADGSLAVAGGNPQAKYWHGQFAIHWNEDAPEDG